jgi:Cu+-exporting ATPase
LSISKELEVVDGVSSAVVSLITEEAVVRHDRGVTPEQLKETIEDCGFEAQVVSTAQDDAREVQGPWRTRLKVTGMTCSNCTQAITKAIQPLQGVSKFDISLITEEAVVDHNDSITAAQLKEEIEDCGFDAEVIETADFSHDEIVETVISVKGMTCGACTSSVTNVLNDLSGVVGASVSLLTEQALVKHYKSLGANELCEAIEDCGFDAKVLETLDSKQSPLMETTNFEVDNVEGFEALNACHGVISTLLIGDGCLAIKYDSNVTGVRDLIASMREININATPQKVVDVGSQLETLKKLKEISFWKWNFIKTAVVGFPMFIVHHVLSVFGIKISLHLFHGLYLQSVIELVLSTYIQFTVGLFFWRNAISSFKHGSGTMDTLVCISTNISYYFSIFTMVLCFINNSTKMAPHTLFETAVLLMNFVSLGKWLESKAKSETSTALSKLISLTSAECTIVDDVNTFDPATGVSGTTVIIPIDYLQVNDIVDIKPGERIPADGIIVHGASEIDESLFTGESLPIPKHINDKVIGGSINGVGHIFVKVATTSENSQLAKIIKLVKTAQMNRAPIQSYADYIASIFVPTIVVLSLLTFFSWLILCHTLTNPPAVFNDANGETYICLKIAISVIVVACPCALGLAAPTGIMVGTGVGASNGILIKGGDILEIANDIDVILFDKTGTLTLGEMIVKEAHILGDMDTEIVMQIIGSTESKSEHPIGVAITHQAKFMLGVDNFEAAVEDFEVQVGKGLVGNVTFKGNKYNVEVGNLKMFSDEFLKSDPVFSQLMIDSDNTLAHIVINGQYQGYLELQDMVKKDSKAVISYFKSQGYEVAMVTGDSQKAANKIASQVGIPMRNVYAEISPYGKEQLVRDFQSRDLTVAFVGDGINDSPALATSDLGIAIASGSDIAIEAADIVILKNEAKLSGVSSALSIAVKTFNKIKWNFFWSSVYNLTMVPLAMGVLIPWGIQMSPLVAGMSMALSSVSVVINSLFLKRWTAPDISQYELMDDDEDFDVESGQKRSKKWNLGKSIKGMLNSNKKKEQDIELQEGLLN